MKVRRLDWLPVFAIGMGSVLGVVTSAVLADMLNGPHASVTAVGVEAAAPLVESGEQAVIRVPALGPHPTLEPAPPPRLWIETRGAQAVPPIVYIDGVRQEGTAALDGLQPSAIERIEVVKDRAAVELFGEEAVGGVIQIYLKRDVEPSTRR